MEHQAVAEVVGLLRRQDLSQLCLHLGRVLGAVGKAQLTRDTDAVGIRHHHAGDMVDVPQNEVGRLASHPRELQQVLHIVGHLAVKLLQHHLRGGHDVPGLGPEKAGGVDVRLHLGDIGLSQGFQGGETGKQGGSHHVYPLVGTLGRQADGKQQLVGLGIVEGADPLRIEDLELLHDGSGPLFLCHIEFLSMPYCRRSFAGLCRVNKTLCGRLGIQYLLSYHKPGKDATVFF